MPFEFPHPQSKNIAVIGAGISGVIAAKTAAKNNFKTLVVDEKNELGGTTIYQNSENYKIENHSISTRL